MRYNLESALPINAFSPRGGRSPFARGMTLEGGGGGGGGGGGFLGGVTSAIGSAVGAIEKGVGDVVRPVYDATLKNIPGVDDALVGLDKSVGKTIPGGWGTVGAVASSFIPGAALASLGMTSTGLATGVGALSGSGVLRKGNNFNLQGAILGGALAYGAAELNSAFQNAGKDLASTASGATADAVSKSATPSQIIEQQLAQNTAADVAPSFNPNFDPTGGGAPTSQSFDPNFDPTGGGTNPPAPIPEPPAFDPNFDPTGGPRPPIMESLARGDIGDALQTAGSNVGTKIAEAPGDILKGAKSGLDALTSKSTYTDLGNVAKGTASNVADAGTGIKNLVTGNASLPDGTLTKTVVPMVVGASGLAALEEQKKYLEDQASAGAISNAEYNAELARINDQIATGKSAVSANPLRVGTDINTVEEKPTFYAKKNKSLDSLYDKYSSDELLYAAGGAVNPTPTNPPDDQTSIANQSPIQQIGAQDSLSGLRSILGLGGNQPTQQSLANIEPYQPNGGFPSQLDSGTGSSQPTSAFGGLGGQLGSGSQGAFPLQGNYGIVKMAAGGMPRFLSGGGDGMSDSIHANIDGSQEARLADGEFVIPADVVSHLGNGSSKAGAKQLYSMMDRVRQARVGNKKQGKQINPRKLLSA